MGWATTRLRREPLAAGPRRTFAVASTGVGWPPPASRGGQLAPRSTLRQPCLAIALENEARSQPKRCS
jgi:hypothetical protein